MSEKEKLVYIICHVLPTDNDAANIFTSKDFITCQSLRKFNQIC